MSHNKIKVGTAEPDRTGDISVSISDMSDVSVSTPASGQLLKYDGSAWANATATIDSQYIWIGQGESNAYSNTGNTGAISVGDAWYVYDSAPTNSITGASITKIGATDWVDYITLPEGNYTVDAQFFAEWTASGYLEVQLFRSTASTPSWTTSTSYALSSAAYIGETLGAYAVTNVLTGQFTISASNVSGGTNRIRLQVKSSSNLASYDGASNQGTTPSKYNYLYIQKV